jgi:hypothetical protein
METVLKELSLYDLTGYLLPGVVVVWSLVYVADASRFRREKDRLELTTVVIIIAGYITGHMLQAIGTFLEQNVISSMFWQPPTQIYFNDPAFRDSLMEAIKNSFGYVAKGKEFLLCQTYLQVHGLDAFTDIMQARYAFFKGLTLALFISCCAFVVESLIWYHRRTRLRGLQGAAKRYRNMIIIAGVLFLATLLSFWRLMAFESYYIDNVYRTFYVGVKTGPGPAGH